MNDLEAIPFFLMIGGPVVYVSLQVYAVLRLTGGWRMASLLPLLGMVPVAIISGIALSLGSNLWPIWLILGSPFAVIYLLAVVVLARVRGKTVSGSPPE
jgi:hypothetical protein